MKDLGALKYLLGIEVAMLKIGIFLSQRKYVTDLLTKIGMIGYIAYVVSVVSQFMHSPNVSHRNAIDWIFIYLKSATGKGLMFSKKGNLDVVGYTDIDWAGSITDRRSTSGYFTFVGGNLVTWRSKK
ncbi:hypothetical protein L3X38_033929 [Prunus dulcis]|uniref:Mitochondrial protein n=1 Tax=Prunus dulcis TaxID=3755 RepID=A0AAD4VJ06_PRUDU|nr:hypothetical protein L3X38_033929 [Prunus dulcis]